MKYLHIFILIIALASCQNADNSPSYTEGEKDHTFSNFESVRTTHLEWKATVDFDHKKIVGIAKWRFNNLNKSHEIIFDIADLNISEVLIGDKKSTFEIMDHQSKEGQALKIPIEEKDSSVTIVYETGKNGKALQWLSPSQTAGKKMPYLFTQCESIYARSLLPCQDAPANRITYNATVQVPEGMMALMSAKNPKERNPKGLYDFVMSSPVPTYLIALAVGDISYKAIDERCGVYTEPVMLNRCAEELSELPRMMSSAEKLGGPYQWERYDVLICPPSFPIGGMENPRLTFATPTIIAGDKSLTNLIAHELAHSWSGNYVTNSNWNDLWLNEGFTVYFERRIMEELNGKEFSEMNWEIGYQDMMDDIASLPEADQRLKVNLKNREPEDAFSNIPYEKGAFFLKTLESAVGREAFDKWLNKYFTDNAFKPMSTAKALEHLRNHLKPDETKMDIDAWVFKGGVPKNIDYKYPARFQVIDDKRIAFLSDAHAENLGARSWSTEEWLHFLRKLPRPLDMKNLKSLESSYFLTRTKNYELANEWLQICIASQYEPAYPYLESFLMTVGRKKFLEPLYGELLKTEEGRKRAEKIFEKARENYHPLTAKKIKSLF